MYFTDDPRVVLMKDEVCARVKAGVVVVINVLDGCGEGRSVWVRMRE